MFRTNAPLNPFHDRYVEWEVPPDPARLVLIDDHARSILSENDSPDIGFRWSVNPYRGCTHACAYCYARRTHEYLDDNAGTDFERRIYVKREAAALLQAAFDRPSWVGEAVNFSGATDCYQPVERKLEITRACLAVCARYRNPISVITRSPLVLRDLDLLVELASVQAAWVVISMPIVDPEVQRKLEPGAPPPAARLRAIRALAEAGVPVGVSLGPIVPGVNDHTLPGALQAAAEAGATWAWSGLVRLPGSVREVFEARLREALPLRAEAVLARLARQREGQRAPTAFGERMRGRGEEWEVTRALFAGACRRLGMGDTPVSPSPSPFRRPGRGVQLGLFERGPAGRG